MSVLVDLSKSLLILSLFFFCADWALAGSVKKNISPEKKNKQFVVLCYHDVSVDTLGNAFSVRKKDFVEQMEFLRAHYNVVSLSDILAAARGQKELPDRAVLLTVDDGLASFYDNVFPLLKAYKMPAVFGIVGQWTENGVSPDYGFKTGNPKMASWKQLKEMSESGFVDVVSHSYNLHQSHVFNPQGNQEAMASFFKYDPQTKSYETEEQLYNRVKEDLVKNNQLLQNHLGKALPVIVWPYGGFNGLSSKAAADAGLSVQFTLESGFNSVDNLASIGRGLVFADTSLSEFAEGLRTGFVSQDPLRMLRLDLETLWHDSDAEKDISLGNILEQTLDLGINAVLVQGVSSNNESYFWTSALPNKGDYLNRTSHSLHLRARVPNVFAKIPLSSLKSEAQAKTLFRDLAKYTDVDGVFIEKSEKNEALKMELLLAAFASGKEIRPLWQLGVLGEDSLESRFFDHQILSYEQFQKLRSSAPATQWQSGKYLVSLPKDFKDEAPQLIQSGVKNLYYDVNFQNVILNQHFRDVFSVRKKTIGQIKGEAK